MTMDPKTYLTNKSFCPLPWTGFYYQMDGSIKNCTQSSDFIGNIKDDSIEQILAGEKNSKIKREMLVDAKPASCAGCHRAEQGAKGITDVMSSRLYYLRQLKKVPMDTYDSIENFDLRHVDLRWQNTCNFACVYCDPIFSSKWESELGVHAPRPDDDEYVRMKNFVLDNAHKLENIYLAGGEPMLMTENEELLEKLLDCNHSVELRVNTNLSNTRTRIFDLIRQFPNVHWTLSVESMNEEFEYIRYGGKWNEFLNNLDTISGLGHRITFNMLWFILNHRSLFDTVDFFSDRGFGPNSFALGPIVGPRQLDIRNLPQDALQSLERLLEDRISMRSGYLLEDGYRVLINHLRRPHAADPSGSIAYLSEIDSRRGLDSRKIFTEFYGAIERQQHG